MQDYNTIVGVIQMRHNDCSFSVIQKRYHIGSGTAQLILKRFDASGLSLDDLRAMDSNRTWIRIEYVRKQKRNNWKVFESCTGKKG